ncbi:hypothetical protein [Rhodanobacter soli]|uniref:HNH endonuclease n=1 Tax=Rhodanobacter soli TaxID=590609 RepID=A0ABV2PRP8_9GAMM
MKQQTVTEHTTDADGQQLVHIALGDSGKRATLYAEDYQRLMDAGFSPCWQYTGDGRGYAYATLGAYNAKGVDCLVPVARLIAQAKAGQVVRYADGNPLNLRAENLKLMAGTARYGAADWYPNAAALLDAGIAPKASDWREGSRPPRKPQKLRRAPVRTAEVPLKPEATQCDPETATAPHRWPRETERFIANFRSGI